MYVYCCVPCPFWFQAWNLPARPAVIRVLGPYLQPRLSAQMVLVQQGRPGNRILPNQTR